MFESYWPHAAIILLTVVLIVSNEGAKALGYWSIFCLFDKKPPPPPAVGDTYLLVIGAYGNDVSKVGIRCTVLSVLPYDPNPTPWAPVYKERWPTYWCQVEMHYLGKTTQVDKAIEGRDFGERLRKIEVEHEIL